MIDIFDFHEVNPKKKVEHLCKRTFQNHRQSFDYDLTVDEWIFNYMLHWRTTVSFDEFELQNIRQIHIKFCN